MDGKTLLHNEDNLSNFAFALPRFDYLASSAREAKPSRFDEYASQCDCSGYGIDRQQKAKLTLVRGSGDSKFKIEKSIHLQQRLNNTLPRTIIIRRIHSDSS